MGLFARMVSVTNVTVLFQDQCFVSAARSSGAVQYLPELRAADWAAPFLCALCHEGAREILPYIMDVLASHRSLRAMVPHLGG
jgi:hypothetical protein